MQKNYEKKFAFQFDLQSENSVDEPIKQLMSKRGGGRHLKLKLGKEKKEKNNTQKHQIFNLQRYIMLL